tara:strand:- start:553 stop:1044 length:492 start_codon:yes stop_codon:yes gene_type:complete
MKILLLVIFTLIISIPSALGLVLSEEGTGLTQNFIVQTGGYDFPVKVTGNLDVKDLSFDKDMKTITMSITSSLDGNLMEILIPQNLINGEFTFFLDNVEVFPQVALLTDNAFITLEFEGEGMHTLDIIGTTYLPEFADVAPIVLATSLIGIIVILKRYKKLSY